MRSPVVHQQTPAQHSCGLISPAQEVELRLYTPLPALGHPRNNISAELEFRDYGALNRPGRIRNASYSTTPKLPFPL